MPKRSTLSERIEQVLFGGLTEEEREKALADYNAADREFGEIRREIQSAGHVSPYKWKVPVL